MQVDSPQFCRTSSEQPGPKCRRQGTRAEASGGVAGAGNGRGTPRNRSAIDFRSFENFDFFKFQTHFFGSTCPPLGLAAPHRSSPARRAAAATGRAQRRQDASQVPGITAERCGIDPQSIFEVLKILKFFKIFKIFPRFGLPPGPGPSAHTGWLERRRGTSPRGRGPQRRVLDSPHLLHLSQRS